MSTTQELSPLPGTPERDPERPSVKLVRQMRLIEGEPIAIDATYPIIDVTGVAEELGIDGATAIAQLRAGGTDFIILDTRGSTQYESPFLIISDTYRYSKDTGYKGIYPGKEIIIGRTHFVDRFAADSKLSRDHFSIFYDEETDALSVADIGSMNGTYLTAYIQSDTENTTERAVIGGIRDEMTTNLIDSFRRARNYGDKSPEAPYGYYRNHAIIGRKSTTVSNGIYGTIGSEFIVVDDKSRLLQETVGRFIDSLPSTQDTETVSVEGILRRVNDYVASTLNYDLKSVEELSSPHYGNKGLIDLSEYVDRHVGVCRHQALLAALVVEEAIRKGYLEGQVGVERNHDLELRGAHAWAVYKSHLSGSDIIIDPAQGFVGTRRQAKERKLWRYEVANDDE